MLFLSFKNLERIAPPRSHRPGSAQKGLNRLGYYGVMAELKLHLVVEIDFVLSPNHSSSAPEFYRIYSNRHLVCTCKLAKLNYLRNTSRIGYRE